jgi:hypothetical protein
MLSFFIYCLFSSLSSFIFIFIFITSTFLSSKTHSPYSLPNLIIKHLQHLNYLLFILFIWVFIFFLNVFFFILIIIFFFILLSGLIISFIIFKNLRLHRRLLIYGIFFNVLVIWKFIFIIIVVIIVSAILIFRIIFIIFRTVVLSAFLRIDSVVASSSYPSS